MTTYTLNESTGIVTRDDGVVVCPAQSDTDANFIAYTTWLGEGNTPNIVAVNPATVLAITRRAFRARFTIDERVAMDLASIDDPAAAISARQEAAAIRTLMKDVDDSTYIDLANQTLLAGMAMLVQYGIITAVRESEIINTPIAQDERPD